MNLSSHLTACTFLLIVLLSGCGGEGFRIAPVSGRVTLDGQPLEGAKVVLLPQGSGEDAMAGPMSNGITDAEGRYTVSTVSLDETRRDGAVVGTHRVAITSRRAEPDPNDPLGAETVHQAETVPAPYNSVRNSPLQLEVPREGTTEANFDLESP